MSKDLTISFPDEIGQAVEKAALDGGQTVDEVVTAAVKRYLARKTLDDLSRYGADRARELGLDKRSEDEQMDYVNRVIQECRKENRSQEIGTRKFTWTQYETQETDSSYFRCGAGFAAGIDRL